MELNYLEKGRNCGVWAGMGDGNPTWREILFELLELDPWIWQLSFK